MNPAAVVAQKEKFNVHAAMAKAKSPAQDVRHTARKCAQHAAGGNLLLGRAAKTNIANVVTAKAVCLVLSVTKKEKFNAPSVKRLEQHNASNVTAMPGIQFWVSPRLIRLPITISIAMVYQRRHRKNSIFFGGHFEIDRKKQRLSEIAEMETLEGFWQDADHAAKIQKEKSKGKDMMMGACGFKSPQALCEKGRCEIDSNKNPYKRR